MTPTKPGSASLPFFGIEPAIIDPVSGVEIHGNDVEGVLAFKQSWPSMARTVWGAHKRYMETYMKVYPGYYVSCTMTVGEICANDENSSPATVLLVTTRASTGSEDVSTMSSTSAVTVSPLLRSRLPSLSITLLPMPPLLVLPMSSPARRSTPLLISRSRLSRVMPSAKSLLCKCVRALDLSLLPRQCTLCQTCPRLAVARLCAACCGRF